MIKTGMSARDKWAFTALGFVFFLTACGDLGMVLPSQGSYRVNAQVNGDYTLDSYSVITKNSKIRPYFVNSVINDPDVRGITVFVQDYSGAAVSRKVHYQLADEAQAPSAAPETPKDAPPEDLGEEKNREAGFQDLSGEEASGDAASASDSAGTAPPGSTEAGDGVPGSSEDPPALGFAEGSGEAPAHSPGGDAGTPGGSVPAYSGGGSGGFAPDASGGGLAGADAQSAEAGETDVRGEGIAAADSDRWNAAGTGAAGGDSARSDTVETDSADSDAADRNTAGTEFGGSDAAEENSAAADSAKTEDGNRAGAGTKGGSTNTAEAESEKTDSGAADAAKAPLPEDETLRVKQLDQYFPEFQIIEDMAIGRYNLVFHVVGEKEILYKTFKPIYFIGDAAFSLGEIRSFLPVEITGGRLIPPGINVMLSTEVNADSRLDPYIIWHSGKKIIAQGRLSGGANSLFWKTPEQTGFHSIRVEVFPLLPGDRAPGNMIGRIKELSLPVSSRSESTRHFEDPSGEFIGWYQFWGTLDDAKAPGNPERKLVSLYSRRPRWMPVGGIYGLLVGRDDVYTLPGAPFAVSGGEQGKGRILFHLGPLSEGSVLSLRFAEEEAKEGLETAELDLFFAGGALNLRIASNDAFREESLGLNNYGNGFITIIVEFTIAPDRFEAELLLKNPSAATGTLSIPLSAAVSGGGYLCFGDYAGQGGRPASAASGNSGGGTLAINELAFSYTRTPVPPEEASSASGLPETLAAKEEKSGARPETLSLNAL